MADQDEFQAEVSAQAASRDKLQAEQDGQMDELVQQLLGLMMLASEVDALRSKLGITDDPNEGKGRA